MPTLNLVGIDSGNVTDISTVFVLCVKIHGKCSSDSFSLNCPTQCNKGMALYRLVQLGIEKGSSRNILPPKKVLQRGQHLSCAMVDYSFSAL